MTTPLTALLFGNESLTRECGEAWMNRGHSLAAVVTENPVVSAWATARDCSLGPRRGPAGSGRCGAIHRLAADDFFGCLGASPAGRRELP